MSLEIKNLDDLSEPNLSAFMRGVEAANNRSIKLLEELKEFWSEKVEFEYGTVSAINADEAIAAIKGETE